jgi:pseudaminic acid biosynthesis-associated methylase
MAKQTSQLDAWCGDFGKAYTDRNVEDPAALVRYFREMLGGLELGRILEIGCNRGHNLVALEELFPEALVAGVEPNSYALGIARRSGKRLSTLQGDLFDIPFKDGFFDLVLTRGVLIHVALADLPDALNEIWRVSRRYILCAEYFAEQETVIPYRGHDDLLWKRDFRRHYLERFPGLKVVRSGYSERDRAHWWAFEKAEAAGR